MNGMIGGQVLDMGAEHRKISLDELRLLQKLKTGCLLRAACELGCAAAGATDEDTLTRARAYGEKLGLAFQIEDDILDIEGDAATLGKSIGKDAASEKSTFPSLLGLEECRELAAKLTEEAVNAVKPLNGHAFSSNWHAARPAAPGKTHIHKIYRHTFLNIYAFCVNITDMTGIPIVSSCDSQDGPKNP